MRPMSRPPATWDISLATKTMFVTQILRRARFHPPARSGWRRRKSGRRHSVTRRSAISSQEEGWGEKWKTKLGNGALRDERLNVDASVLILGGRLPLGFVRVDRRSVFG